MWPDRLSNPGPLALQSDALPTALDLQCLEHGVLFTTVVSNSSLSPWKKSLKCKFGIIKNVFFSFLFFK